MDNNQQIIDNLSSLHLSNNNNIVKYRKVIEEYYLDGKIISSVVIQQESSHPSPIKISVVNPVTEIEFPAQKDLLYLDWIKDWNGIVVAGGHILNTLIGDRVSNVDGDIDIFFVNPIRDVNQMKQKISQIYSWLCDYVAINNEKPKIRIRNTNIQFLVYNPRNRYYLNSKGKSVLQVQIIFMMTFKDVVSVLSNFDLNNCQFAYKSGSYYATPLALNYLQTMQIYYHQPKDKESSAWSLNRINKYKKRPYNKIVEVDRIPYGCSTDNMINYLQSPSEHQQMKDGENYVRHKLKEPISYEENMTKKFTIGEAMKRLEFDC